MDVSEKRGLLRDRAAQLIRSGTCWRTAAEIGRTPEQLNQWVEEGALFGLPAASGRVFPGYAFDFNLRPLPGLAPVLEALAERDPWRVAAWFESTSSFLDGQRPRELLATSPDAVLRAAEDRGAERE